MIPQAFADMATEDLVRLKEVVRTRANEAHSAWTTERDKCVEINRILKSRGKTTPEAK